MQKTTEKIFVSYSFSYDTWLDWHLLNCYYNLYIIIIIMLLFIDIAHKNPYANRPRIQPFLSY